MQHIFFFVVHLRNKKKVCFFCRVLFKSVSTQLVVLSCVTSSFLICSPNLDWNCCSGVGKKIINSSLNEEQWTIASSAIPHVRNVRNFAKLSEIVRNVRNVRNFYQKNVRNVLPFQVFSYKIQKLVFKNTRAFLILFYLLLGYE